MAISIFIMTCVFPFHGGPHRLRAPRGEGGVGRRSAHHHSEGGTFDAAIGYKVLANSHGFIGDYQRSYCSVSAVPIAQLDDSAMQRDYWYSVANSLKKLESPEEVGQIAASARCGGWAHAR